MDDAEDAAIDAVLTAIERDTASGNGITVARITEEGVDIEQHEDLAALQ
jgi:proteasome beta subunit